MSEDPLVSVRMTSPGGGTLMRAFRLSSYDLETIAGEVRRLGRGARVEMTVHGGDAELAEVRQQFAWAADRDVELSVSPPRPSGERLPRTHGADVGAPPRAADAGPARALESSRRTFDVGDVVHPDDLPPSVRCRVIAVERLRVPGGLLQFLTLEPCGDVAPMMGGRRLVRLSHAVSRASDPAESEDEAPELRIDSARGAAHLS